MYWEWILASHAGKAVAFASVLIKKEKSVFTLTELPHVFIVPSSNR